MREAELYEQLTALVHLVADLAREAGRRILAVYEGGYAVAHKQDRTPVTEADLLAHETLSRGLAELEPSFGLVSEEGPEIPFAERRAWETLWMVDPLDGTREFIRRNGEFSVNVALVHRHEPVLGVIHVPVTNATFFACRGRGAFRMDAHHRERRITVQRPVHDPPVVAVSRRRHGANLRRFLDRLGPHETYEMGSSLKSCLVAEGIVDVYPSFGPTSEWDTAAAQCLVEEAGGAVFDTHLRPLRYNRRESLSNPYFLAVGEPDYDWAGLLAEHK